MRATTLLNPVLGIKFTRVTGARFTQDGLVCDVEPTTEILCCGGCGRRVRIVLMKLEEWISWATHSGLKPFAKVARTIAKHLDGIVAYVATGLSNARSKGTNGKVRTITRRSYGLRGASALIALIHLCCSDLNLQPVHVLPRFHQS